MATARPFAYNTGAPITGTEQVGSLAVGYPTAGFVGLPWWNGPDEDLGYVIARSVPGNNQPVPVGTGATGASVGFFRSSALTEPSFISIANYVAGPSGGGPFASGSAAKTWLNANGYWTSFSGGATGGTGSFNVTISQVGFDVVWSGSGSFNLTDLTLTSSSNISPGFAANQAIWAIGVAGNYDAYGGASLTYPTTMSTGGGGGGSPTATGDLVGVIPGGPTNRVILVPSGYTSGSPLSSSVIYSNTTIAGLGLSGGTYTWAWGSGANESSLVMVIN